MQILNKLKTNRGVFLSLIAYPILILLIGFSLGSFIGAINNNGQAKTSLKAMQAQFEAYKGLEYALFEIKSKALTSNPFETAKVALTTDTDMTLEPSGISINPEVSNNLFETIAITDGVYSNIANKTDPSAKGFEVKTYRRGKDIFVLVKGKYNGMDKLFLKKISYTSMYDYLFFYPGTVSFGDETFDAAGGKIHANGEIELREGFVLNNVMQFSTPSKIYFNYYYKEMRPGTTDESSLTMFRYPWWNPAGYDPTNPPSDTTGVYRNSPDGHFPGDKYGLYTKQTALDTTSNIIPWTPTADCDLIALGQQLCKPIPPSPGLLDTAGSQVPGAANGIVWDNNTLSYIYSQNTMTKDGSNKCDASVLGNANCSPTLPKINGVYIPNRIGQAPYDVKKYWVTDTPTPYAQINLTDSDGGTFIVSSDAKNSNQTVWDNFVSQSSVQKTYEPGNANFSVTGLNTLVKAGQRNGADYITPPKVPINQLVTEARDNGSGIVIQNAPGGTVEVRINAQDPLTWVGNEIKCPGTNLVLFKMKKFMNTETALRNDVIDVDIGNLKTCAATGPGGALAWLPKNGLVYGNYGHGLMISNAEVLPDNGLTYIVKGNLYIKGDYNTGTWQPSAAIVSDYSYLLSDKFSEPTWLPFTQHHPHYPTAKSYDGSHTLQGMEQSGYNPDYVSGYNWLTTPNIYGGNYSGTNETNMANKALDVNNNYQANFTYNISLVGSKAYNPRFLERWKFYNVSGNSTTAPSDPKEVKAVVKGSFIKINPNDFSPVQNLASPTNPRYCDSGLKLNVDSTTTLDANGSNYPCRNVAANSPERGWYPDDLIIKFSKEEKKYENNFLANTKRPPGNFLGLQEGDVIELSASDPLNWLKHQDILLRSALPPPGGGVQSPTGTNPIDGAPLPPPEDSPPPAPII